MVLSIFQIFPAILNKHWLSELFQERLCKFQRLFQDITCANLIMFRSNRITVQIVDNGSVLSSPFIDVRVLLNPEKINPPRSTEFSFSVNNADENFYFTAFTSPTGSLWKIVGVI